MRSKEIIKKALIKLSPSYRKIDRIQKDVNQIKAGTIGKMSPGAVSESNIFIDRKKNYDTMLIILAGYKKDLWDITIERIHQFLPEKIDVCIVTSGKDDETLKEYCIKYNWSYLGTDVNCLTLAQNLAIDYHPAAEWIYKIDEDMFITEGFFENMKSTYQMALTGHYVPGFVAPLINVNGYGYIRILERLGLLDDYELHFGKAAYTDGLTHHREVILNTNFAKYMWGVSKEELRSIDKLNRIFQSDPPSYSICALRFSIGAILFTRSMWLSWGRFPVPAKGNGLGLDEEAVCWRSMFQSRVIIVSDNSVVGHLGFGGQSKEMTKYYLANRELFLVSTD